MSTATVSQPVSVMVPARSLPGALLVRWHLFSLDAPSVAVVWLLLLNRHAPRLDRLIEAAALALAVWCIYALDRLLDAAGYPGELHRRHHFHRLHRQAFLAGLGLATPAMLVLVVLLPHTVRLAWVALAIPLTLYAAIVHLVRSAHVPKEKCVGLFFAVAVSLPALGDASNLPLLLTQTVLFGLLCWLNCVAIARWEQPATGTGRHPKQLNLLLAMFVASSSIFTMVTGLIAVGLPLIVAGVLLSQLHRLRHRFDSLLLRSLADAALLTPLLVLPFVGPRW